MPIDVESVEARKFRHLDRNPEFANLQPRVRVLQNPRINEVRLYTGVSGDIGYSADIRYRTSVPRIRSSNLEQRVAGVIFTSRDEIIALSKVGEFVIPQIAVENPNSEEEDWRAHVWLKPREEVVYGLTDAEAFGYNSRLVTGQVPWVDISRINKSYYSALDRIRKDNSAYIQKLDDKSPSPFDESELRRVVDKFDPYTPYSEKYSGMLLDQINLPRTDMLTTALLVPNARAEYLVMTSEEKTAFLNAKMKEGLRAVGERKGPNSVAAMVDFLRKVTSSDFGTSHGDMMSRFKELGSNGSYKDSVRSKLLHALNLAPSQVVTLAFMEPATRLSTLIQDGSGTDEVIYIAFQEIQARVNRLPVGRIASLADWYGLDGLIAA